MSAEHEAIATRLLDAFNRGDLEEFKGFFAADAEIVPLRAALENTVFRGPAAAEEFFAATQESWDSPRLEIEQMRSEGDLLLVLGRFRARGRASGAEIDVSPGWVMRFRDGAITVVHTYADRGDAAAAAGLAQ